MELLCVFPCRGERLEARAAFAGVGRSAVPGLATHTSPLAKLTAYIPMLHFPLSAQRHPGEL